MLEILFIYFVGKKFYELSHEYRKNNWLFAILGVITFYGAVFLGSILLGIIFVLTNATTMLELPKIVFGLMCLPFGFLAAWGLYKILENNWKKELNTKKESNEILDEL